LNSICLVSREERISTSAVQNPIPGISALRVPWIPYPRPVTSAIISNDAKELSSARVVLTEGYLITGPAIIVVVSKTSPQIPISPSGGLGAQS